MKLFKRTGVGVDLGTSSTLVYVAPGGVVLTEPSVVALDRVSGRVIAVGEEARKRTGKAGGGVLVVRPLREGVVHDFDATTRMLAYFFKKAVGKQIKKPMAIVCMPSGVTGAEKHCIAEAALEAGAGQAYLIEEPVAAAIGAGLDVLADEGRMVLDIGGGTTDIAILYGGCVVLSDSVRVAGDACNRAIEVYLAGKHGLSVGESGAEDVKIAYGRAHMESEQRVVEIRGRSLVTGLPESVPVGTNELVDALQEPLRLICRCMGELLARTPQEILSGIRENGVLMTGGGALLTGLGEFVSDRLDGIPCKAADDPITCVIRGIGAVLADPEKYNGVIQDYQTAK